MFKTDKAFKAFTITLTTRWTASLPPTFLRKNHLVLVLHGTDFSLGRHCQMFRPIKKNDEFLDIVTLLDGTKAFVNHSPMMRTSALQPISADTMSMWHWGGSRGNSAIWRPSGVRAPVPSKAPRIHSWYMELRMVSYGDWQRHRFLTEPPLVVPLNCQISIFFSKRWKYPSWAIHMI